MMPAGEYWIGDLCYVLDDDWDEVCSLYESGAGQYTMSDGRRFAMYGTFYGDGVYEDESKNTYSVDSGTLGCIKVSHIDGPSRLGNVVKFAEPFETCELSDGVLKFGHIYINTKDF